jgi:hypothetical protein
MNPEFERNVWLELTPLRMIVMAAVLALAFFAAALTQGTFASPGGAARWLFYIIVVIWGTRNAARSVVGEIRERTWDGQRLSSLDAGTMMWGKLFGSTIFNWYGGAICLAVIVAETIDHSGIVTALVHLVYYIALGLITQSVSLLASLIAAGRRQARTQFEVFLYQIAGIAAGVAVWAIADPTGPSIGGIPRSDVIQWWGQSVPAQPFLLASLAVFAGWTLMGSYRQMRLELKLRNGPLVWLGFLVFMAVYVAGFDAWVATNQGLAHFDVLARRLLLAGVTCGVLGYVMVILEPKNRVHYRWLASEFGRFHLGTALGHLQCWMIAYLAAILIGIGLVVRLSTINLIQDQAIVAAMLGFFTRDMAIVVLMNVVARRRGGDLMSIALLILLYGLLPAIVAGLHYLTGQALFLPRPTEPVWLSPAAAWIEAIVLWIMAIASIALPEQQTKPA